LNRLTPVQPISLTQEFLEWLGHAAHRNRASVTIVKELQAATGNVAEAVRLLQDYVEHGRKITL
jgi:hypothetical protein